MTIPQGLLTVAACFSFVAFAAAERDAQSTGVDSRPTQQEVSFRAETPGEVARAKTFSQGFLGSRPILESVSGLRISVNGGIPGKDKAPDYLDFMRTQTCAADAVIVGRVASSKSMLNEAETFIFTDYQIEALEAIRGSARVGDKILVTRIGGSIKVKDRFITASVNIAPPFDRNTRYLLFLDRLKEDGPGFKVRTPSGDVEERGLVANFPSRNFESPMEFFTKTLLFRDVLGTARKAAEECR